MLEAKQGFRTGPVGFVGGAYAVVAGLVELIKDGELRKLAIVPILITAAIYPVVIGLVVYFVPGLASKVFQPPEGALFVAYVAGIVILCLLLVGVMLLCFTIFASLIGGPFYDKLAVTILERGGHSTKEPAMIKGLVSEIVRSIVFVVPVILFAMLGLVPVIGVPFAALGVGLAWFGLGAQAVNPSLMVTGYSTGGRIRFMTRHFFTMAGMGAVVGASLLVPFLGLISIPSSIIGAANLAVASELEPS